MKMLDEVIDCMERCSKPHYFDCNGCPYEDEEAECGCHPEERDADVLHYLRELQLFRKTPVMQGIHKAQEEYATYPVEDWNPALTWDELRTMEGKPVWVELTFPEGAYSHWGIIWGFPKAGYEFMELWGFHEIQSFSVMQKEQGKTWQAYRKERTDGKA